MTTTVMITSAISMQFNQSITGVTARLVEGRHRHVRQRAAALLPAALRVLVAVDVVVVGPSATVDLEALRRAAVCSVVVCVCSSAQLHAVRGPRISL